MSFELFRVACHKLVEAQGVPAAVAYHDEERALISLRNIENTERNLTKVRRALDRTGTPYRLEVLEPHRHRSNMHLLDIGQEPAA